MIDQAVGAAAPWLAVLREVARSSAHEMRNALNGLVVNLEVVRSRTGRDSPELTGIAQFVEDAVAQSEESAKLAEASAALMDLVLGAVGSDGRLHCELEGPRTLRILSTDAEADRAVRALRALGARTGLGAECAGQAVILRFPLQNPATNTSE
ncbi:MAG: hypothetical protein H0T48_01685 [Gemmatimonadaceae bacterium]|nr:hypothetical protein [Gemmatimonadaceae bacterium]